MLDILSNNPWLILVILGMLCLTGILLANPQANLLLEGKWKQLALKLQISQGGTGADRAK
ncbi:MAG: hypothetical protein GDA44_13955 [Prochloron sp. SP5CPC1]|nr:hypothetical protein [Candidatus Paraprochloron terpiosi SP5CPC1]